MALVAKSIRKAYHTDVIKDFSYSFERGRLYLIKGVSGCGKSTLLNILGGLDTDYKGEVTFDGASGKEILTQNIGYVFQQSLLISDLTVYENLALINNDSNVISQTLSRLGVEHLQNKMPSQLSGGERQRVAIGRALITGVNVLLADEPTASLDMRNSESVASLLRELCDGGCTVIVASHEHYFDNIADEIVHLNYGQIQNVDSSNTREIKSISPELSVKIVKPPLVPIVNSRLKRQKKRGATLTTAILILLILFVSTLSSNITPMLNEYLARYYSEDVFTITNNKLDFLQIPSEKDYEIYYPYQLDQDGIKILYYSDENASVLAGQGMIKYGAFPQTADEVLVSFEYCQDQFGEYFTEEDVVGRSIKIAGNEYLIAGCLESFDENPTLGLFSNFVSVFDSDIFYWRNRGSMIFMDYERLGEICDWQPKNAEYIQIYYADLTDDIEFVQTVKSLMNSPYYINSIESTIKNISELIEWFTLLLYLILIICYIIACIFIRSKVDIDLFYRKREIGFLQIFKMPKKHLQKMIMVEYLLLLVHALVYSLVVYFVTVIILSFACDRLIMFNPVHICPMFIVIVGLYIISLKMAIVKFIKKDIVDLIR